MENIRANLPACSFNPCFNGTYSLTPPIAVPIILGRLCFNPCFNGTYSLTIGYIL